MIIVSINNKTQEFDQQTSLAQALQQTNTPTDGIAVAINQEVISQSDWNTCTLKDKDTVLIIKATQGG